MPALTALSYIMLFLFSPCLDKAPIPGAWLIQKAPLPWETKRVALANLVKRGMTREQVVAILGEPRTIYGYGPGCATWYYDEVRQTIPFDLIISFSQDGGVDAITTQPKKSPFPPVPALSIEEIKQILDRLAAEQK